jgi:hypothetical protein
MILAPFRKFAVEWATTEGSWLVISRNGGMDGTKMDYNDHCLRVGYIHMNLAALESALRFVLLKANKETFTSPKPKDADAPLSQITNFASLGWLIKEYNGKLDPSESTQFALDNESARIRDALAHGRLVAPTNEFPLTLWKFGPVKSGRVPIEYNEVLTVDWLDKTWEMINQQKELVTACSKQRGYPIT